jgi:hypothetical protein
VVKGKGEGEGEGNGASGVKRNLFYDAPISEKVTALWAKFAKGREANKVAIKDKFPEWGPKFCHGNDWDSMRREYCLAENLEKEASDPTPAAWGKYMWDYAKLNKGNTIVTPS